MAPEQEQQTEESPYLAPSFLMIAGAVGVAFGWYSYTENTSDVPELLALLLTLGGGIMLQLGIIAIAVLMGTTPLRR